MTSLRGVFHSPLKTFSGRRWRLNGGRFTSKWPDGDRRLNRKITRRVQGDMRALVAPFSASYSTKPTRAPTPAVIFGSNATTVAGEGGEAVAFKRFGAINSAAISRPARAFRSGII
jgi:hypothetical protein